MSSKTLSSCLQFKLSDLFKFEFVSFMFTTLLIGTFGLFVRGTRGTGDFEVVLNIRHFYDSHCAMFGPVHKLRKDFFQILESPFSPSEKLYMDSGAAELGAQGAQLRTHFLR